jgi:glycosyltransferase involved in cell wall biosynthesis
MHPEIAVNVALNGVSFGQVSIGLLREMHRREMSPCIFPINPQNVDLSAQGDLPEEFRNWLNECLAKALKSHKRDVPSFKLWHLNGSLDSVSRDQYLFTFYELDQPTAEEMNIIRNQKKVLVSSSYTKSIFEASGADNIGFVPLFFDKDNFSQTEKAKNNSYFKDGRITFNLTGKLEKRKNHHKLIQSWAKKYGDDPKYFLQCAVYNGFLKPEENNATIASMLEGKKYFNINFLGFMAKNELYNDYLNSGDIIIGGSGGEGWGLPEFHSVALGKHSVILNATAYKDWADEINSVMFNTSGKTEAYDGRFFVKGQPFNQGSTFDFEEEEFLEACDRAIERVKIERINEAGITLQKKFTVEKTLDCILKECES